MNHWHLVEGTFVGKTIFNNIGTTLEIIIRKALLP